jgi:GTP cyclohydrolase I
MIRRKEGIMTETEKEHIIYRLLQAIGENPDRPGLLETPNRVVRSWDELYIGYKQDPIDVFKTFEEDGYNELVWMKNIEFFSMCEHHMLPFFGKAHVAYIANDKQVIGASKLARLVDIFARRLTTQERIARQVTESLMQYLKPVGAACIVEAVHLCMRCRGVGKQNSVMGTSCLRGVFLEDSDAGRAARAELIGLLK